MSKEVLRYPGYLLGFRAWKLEAHRLHSLMPAGGGWELGPNTAECRRQQYEDASASLAPAGFLYRYLSRSCKHEAPGDDCECGLYAWHDLGTLGTYFWKGGSNDPAWVCGAVRASGRIEVHGDGFRAQYAEPIALAFDGRDPYDEVMRLKARLSEFSIPLVRLDELQSAANALAPDALPVDVALRDSLPSFASQPWGRPPYGNYVIPVKASSVYVGFGTPLHNKPNGGTK